MFQRGVWEFLFPGFVVEDRAWVRNGVTVADFGAAAWRELPIQGAQLEVDFAVQGLGDAGHGFEGEVGVAAKDFGDVGRGSAQFFRQGSAGDAAGFHVGDEFLREADGSTLGVVGRCLPGRLRLGFEGGKVFHGRKCRVIGDR